jgi:phage shock protein PspC (stress-responsive transcriptional regulator)
MTSTDTMSATPPPAGPRQHLLRRSRTDRVGAGVAGGLGEYFRLDPVLFRVLFATSAFFGGAGILAYLLAWAAIPEEGTRHAPIDGWVRAIRRRRFPFLLATVIAAIILWAVAFSWWAPGPTFPVLVVVIVLFAIFARRDARSTPPPSAEPAPTGPVDLTKGDAATADRPIWVDETRRWLVESRDAHRRRRRRAMPVRLSILGALVATLTVLGLVDAASGIQLRVYFYVVLGIVGLGLLVGMALRRTPWALSVLLIPAAVGSIAYGGSAASLHDGTGQRDWVPTTSLPSNYRLAFGDGVLDLRSLHAQSSPQTVHVRLAGGRVRIIAPATMNLTVKANVRFGQLQVDGIDKDDGAGVDHLVAPLATAKGQPIRVDVELATGQVVVEHR